MHKDCKKDNKTTIKSVVMTREVKADRLYSMVLERFRNEQPERKLTETEKDSLWYAIYGKLCRGETEATVEEYCKTVELNG